MYLIYLIIIITFKIKKKVEGACVTCIGAYTNVEYACANARGIKACMRQMHGHLSPLTL